MIKADVHGSAEAIVGALEKLGGDQVKVIVLHSGVGGINETDVGLARASDALIIGFNVRANPQARELAQARRRRDPLLLDHLRAGRRREGAADRHADADPAREHPRLCRDPGGLHHLQGRQGRRLPGHRRHRPPRRQGPPAARQRRHPRRRPRRSSSTSRKTSARSAKASSAASRSPTIRTSRSATGSSASRSRRWRGSSRDGDCRPLRHDRSHVEKPAFRRASANFASARSCGMRCRRSSSAARCATRSCRPCAVTVTEVRISPDLRQATVFVMPLGGGARGRR